MKTAKEFASCDADARAVLDFLKSHPACTGKLGVMGICIGGHRPFRAAMNADVRAAVCFSATDIHQRGLAPGMNDNSLTRAGEIRGELLMIWGRQDPHVPLAGRSLLRQTLESVFANFIWHEFTGQHAFLRDEGIATFPNWGSKATAWRGDCSHASSAKELCPPPIPAGQVRAGVETRHRIFSHR